ncbi:unnamed protein product [Blepharisma stoltei]|uniref:CCT domain-containing protein n=1 Tax=Blepharisma stoltei TaxID=1481888 RepID=A0AAU9K1C8_9CILI|nr:unnamed protein product [Blepharisma stoltei]
MFDPNSFLGERDAFETDGQEPPFVPPEMAQIFFPGFFLDSENPEMPKREDMIDNFMMPVPEMESWDPNFLFMLDPSLMPKDPQEMRRLMAQSFDYYPMMNPENVEMQFKNQNEKVDLESQFLPKPQIIYDNTKKIGTLTLEERRLKIEKYLEKRKKRTFSKRIAYACRKRVADSRIRIKGRFVTKVQAEALKGLENERNNVSLPLSNEKRNI